MAPNTAHADSTSAIPSSVDIAVDDAVAQPSTDKVADESRNDYDFQRDRRFWFIIVALCAMQVLCSLENTVVVTSLPTIVKQLNLGSNYIWVTNIFFLTA